MSKGNKNDNTYVKSNLDHGGFGYDEENDGKNSCGMDACEDGFANGEDEPNVFEEILTDSECLDLLDDDVCNLNELPILAFFNEFTLMDIGIGDLIREVYFEE